MTTLILSYSLKERSLYNRENNTSIKGSWLYELAKKYLSKNIEIDEHISLFGFDALRRIEIKVSLSLFDCLKQDAAFIMKAENLRRIRTFRDKEGINVLEYLCYPISNFDNDFDAELLTP